MENFFNWLVKPIPHDEVEIWFNMNNMHFEKIELFSDIFQTLNEIILDTYLGYDSQETKIYLTDKEKQEHFKWCWKKTIEIFEKEKIFISETGEHMDYLNNFYLDTFYEPIDDKVIEFISNFIFTVFDLEKVFTKSDLEILSEIYKLFDKNVKY